MTSSENVERGFAASLLGADYGAAPFDHWVLSAPFRPEAARDLARLPFRPPAIDDTNGRRETHNSTRIFFDDQRQATFPVCRSVAEAFQSGRTIGLIERVTGAALGGTSLRLEYCLDTDGFWLEPHTDIGAKRFTMLIYLSDEPESRDWGTDLYNADGTWYARVPAEFDTGLIFIPAANTWHGFAPRPIAGVRRSIIVNYVGPEWRARHELAFPNQAVRAG